VSNGGSLPPDRVPTLTEVVAWPAPAAAVAAPSADPMADPVPELVVDPMASAPPASETAPLAASGTGTALSEEQLTQRVLTDLHRQMELMLDYRLREVLTPLLTRAADSIVREARGELASALRDVVARAVAQELARHRTR
jgi:hypothetical protein